ncbi:MAG TPA: four helix bundle protein [Gemmatimonadaceae bacterium]
MQDPDKLRVSPAAEELAVLVYQLTAAFPREERFGLTLQMRRAAVAIGSNIFEGAGHRTNKQFAASLSHAHSESNELFFQTRLSQRLKFGDATVAAKVKRRTEHVRRMLFNLIKQVDGEE